MRKRIVILGAGISGHTAALFSKKYLGDKVEIVLVSPVPTYNWIPSNIWVGVNEMPVKDVIFDLTPVYQKESIIFKLGKGIVLFPEGKDGSHKPTVGYESTAKENAGELIYVEYDYLINATGPKLSFEMTPGLGPDFYSFSVCTAHHAVEAAKELEKIIIEAKTGIKKTIVVGMGHGSCTCEGAAFEYLFNVDTVLRKNGVRNFVRLVYLTNEFALGDFGVDGIILNMRGDLTPSSIMAESLYNEKEIEWITGAHVKEVEKNKVIYELLNGEEGILDFDFAMLLPPFKGHLLKTSDKDGNDITEKLFSANHFMKVDADYKIKKYEDWSPEDWPKFYQSPYYENIYAVGIAFAPPHQISKPRTSVNGTNITPSPPRTGMPSAVMGQVVAYNIANEILGNNSHKKEASLANQGAACVASVGTGLFSGSAVTITMSPIIPDYKKYPETGRNTNDTFGEIGLAGHWLKRLLHTLFIYKAKAKPFWWIIPE
jgi:sulfide:quinone oxidoreductase